MVVFVPRLSDLYITLPFLLTDSSGSDFHSSFLSMSILGAWNDVPNSRIASIFQNLDVNTFAELAMLAPA